MFKYALNWSKLTVKTNFLGKIIYVQYNSIQVYMYSAFHDANRCKGALQKIKVSTLYLVIAYQWWLSQVDVHMAEMYSKNQAVS